MGLGLAFSARGVALCRARLRGARVEVGHTRLAPLPPGTLRPGLGAPNVADPEALDAALTALLAEGSAGREMAGVALPDASVRVRVLPEAPAGGSPAELRRLIAWRLRDSVPVAPAEVRADLVALPAGALCLLGADPVIGQFEAVLRRRRLVPAHLTAASLALWRLLEAAHDDPLPGGGLALFVEDDTATLLAVEAGIPLAWRVLAAGDPGALAREAGDTVHALREAGHLRASPRLLLHDAVPDETRARALAAETGLPLCEPAWPAGLPAEPRLLPALGAALAV